MEFKEIKERVDEIQNLRIFNGPNHIYEFTAIFNIDKFNQYPTLYCCWYLERTNSSSLTKEFVWRYNSRTLSFEEVFEIFPVEIQEKIIWNIHLFN